MLNAKTYITHQKGIGGRIRTKYEDFYVEEIHESEPCGTGSNTWFFIEEIEKLKDRLYRVKILKIIQNEKKLRIGQLIGNKFRLLIRDSDDPEVDREITNEILTELSKIFLWRIL